jgi:acetyltransferase-like isoleucine patch superfamily enzyme
MITAKPRFPIRKMVFHGWLPSFLKCALYRLRGYRIGRGVKIGFGSVICSKQVEIGNGVTMGFFSFIRGQRVRLGDRVKIGSMCFLDTPYLEIGDDSKLNEQVYVGGLQFPDSRLTVGKNCQIMQMTFINPTKYITIGDDTGIGGDSLIFGHASWLSRFEGYPVDFRPIEIGNSVSVAWRVFIGAGAKIGDGAVIGANSFVNHAIPPKCLATGSPARVVAHAPYFPRKLRDGDRETILQDILAEMVGFLRGSDTTCLNGGNEIEVTWKRKRWLSSVQRSEKIHVSTAVLEGSALPSLTDRTTVFLSLRNIPADLRRQLGERGILWFDIERKERSARSHDLGEEVAQYLRRHGVRFTRLPGQNIEGTP